MSNCSQVATFRKTRHENLVLFMGACMKPPRLAIVTSLCKGNTLYTHIHLRKDKFTANKSVIVAQQISQVNNLSVKKSACVNIITLSVLCTLCTLVTLLPNLQDDLDYCYSSYTMNNTCNRIDPWRTPK